MPKVQDDTPACIKPYLALGVDLSWNETQAVGECPFCGHEKKFYVGLIGNGKHFAGGFDCKVCGLKGNIYSFFNKLHEVAERIDSEYKELQQDRGFLRYDKLDDWGLRKSPITSDWIVPGYNVEGKITQIYTYRPDHKGHRRLVVTTGTSHALMGVNLYQPKKAIVYVCESLWDAMALREVLGCTKREALSLNGTPALTPTSNEGVSLLSESNVLAVPGCNVFDEKWAYLLQDKLVYLLFHSDHPSKAGTCAGYEGMKRVANLLATNRYTPAEIHYMHWGDEGYDPTQKSGYDIRDILVEAGTTLPERIGGLSTILERLFPAPQEWIGAPDSTGKPGQVKIDPLPCTSWADLLAAMKKALEVRQSLEDAFSVMLAVAASTEQTGNQLFLQLIAPPGSAKSDLCDAMLMSSHCYALEHIKGFHSGWMAQAGEDYSLISRIDGKTLITPEGDTMVSSDHFTEIMSQQRRIFDGTTSASYKTLKEDRNYTGLRTPWIIAGTPELLNMDQSRLGDRFVRIMIDPPNDEEKKMILRHVCRTAARGVRTSRKKVIDAGTANGAGNGAPNVDVEMPISNLTMAMLKFRRMTGGYVNHLRADDGAIIDTVKEDNDEWMFEKCQALAEFTARLRARPDMDYKKHRTTDVTVELPTRLTHQFVRLSICLAAVLNKTVVDEEVMRRVTKCCIDTSRGTTLDIVKVLYERGGRGLSLNQLNHLTGHKEEEDKLLLRFLRKLEVLQLVIPKGGNPGVEMNRRWRLSPEFRTLYCTVYNIKEVSDE